MIRKMTWEFEYLPFQYFHAKTFRGDRLEAYPTAQNTDVF